VTTNEDSEVIFKYNFTGTLTARKFLDVKLYRTTASQPPTPSPSLIPPAETSSMSSLTSSETITDSIHYQDLSGTAAIIGFCLRVDYNYVDGDGPPVHQLYETNVTITVDLGQLHSEDQRRPYAR
jgi:hypothetical protein